jgi:hypothetical protein
MDSQLLRAGLISLALAGLAAPVAAQLPPRARIASRDYFPLAVGNQWVYVQRGFAAGGQITVQVTNAGQFNGVTYFELSGLSAEPVWVRRTSAGEIVQWDRAGDRLWYAFGSPAGASWRPQLPVPCTEQADLMTRGADVEVPAGRFPSALVIRYGNGSCADAGLLEEAFAAGVGLLRRAEQTIGGPRYHELAYARIGGVLVAGSELSFYIAKHPPHD